jgi:hypothetical protein
VFPAQAVHLRGFGPRTCFGERFAAALDLVCAYLGGLGESRFYAVIRLERENTSTDQVAI